jgi:heme/copper-type cytochrome/quinol oxidase subunit 2
LVSLPGKKLPIVDAKGEPASINIDITGHQFAWELRYPVKMVN